MTDLTPDTIAQIRNRAENAITYGGRQMTFHPTEVIALLDRVEAAERVAEYTENRIKLGIYVVPLAAQRMELALLRGKENA